MAASLRLFLLAALLVAVVLAAPAPTKRSLSKRSFKVPRSLNKAHPRGLNGPDALRKGYMKYGFTGFSGGFIAATKQNGGFEPSKSNAANTSATANGTGTVAANPEQNAALFLSPVTIGGQTLNLDFDSGSSDLYVIPHISYHR